MSLVGDALRKARQEASEREADRRGVLYSARISDAPGRSHLGLGLALGAFIAVVATIAGGVAVLWFLDRSPEPAVVEATIVEPPAGVPAPDSPTADDAAGRPSQPASGEPGTDRAETTSQPAAAPTPDEATRTQAAESQPPDRDRTVTAASRDFELEDDGTRVYLLEAGLDDVTLSLDYIVSRPEDPFVEINGVELHLGGEVGGFRVKQIEWDRVRLSDGRRTIVLRTP